MQSGMGLKLSQRFYEQVIAPTLERAFPALPYAAARIGLGSEVLGYDTKMSADHDYGPCVQIFLPPSAFPETARAVMKVLDSSMPLSFDGFTVHYPTATRPQKGEAGDILGSDHGAELYTLAAWRDRFLGPDFDSRLSHLGWLSYPEHLFLIVTAGAVFRDDLGELSTVRRALQYFPRDVWLYKIAAQWNRIAEERAYVGRTAEAGDELGSRVIAARMSQNMMRLAMLLERQYAPYPKWFGTAFSRLPCAANLAPLLEQVLSALDWREREEHIMSAVRFLAELQLARKVPGARAPEEGALLDRPFRFIDTVKLSDGILAEIDDEQLRRLPKFGGADQFLGNFVLAVPLWSSVAASALFETALRSGQ
ncbi:hypothetical protein ABIB57_003209 [Devosia sp. UYZn731]|uniref:DUF4037 domain-containing protein n=1 Tax=Devosia sp. UYZn731 TaxID=3156345 RepID=UPI00339745EA